VRHVPAATGNREATGKTPGRARLSFRDLIDRITGRQPRRRRYGAGHTRSRSEPTIQLPKEHRGSPGRPADTPVGPARAITAPEPERGGVHPRPYSQPTPAIGSPVAPGAAPKADAPVPSDAPTQYFQTAPYRKDDVTGVLVAIDGELKGEVFPLFDGENKLGRAEASDLVLASKWISREHAMIVHQEGVFAIVPLTERNRTYVNDREVDGAELADGDTIRLGHTTFRFRCIEGL